MNKGNLINEEIQAGELRVIDENGEQAGIMLLEIAQQMADNRKLDLVLISPNAKPPVAKIMDYGKYRYEQQKREKEARKKQKIIQVKEIRLSTFIEKHDLVVKAHNAEKFLKEGDKVKVSLRFKGRERGRTEKGFEVMERFAALTETSGTPEKRPAFEGRSLIMILAPMADKENKVAKPKNRDKTEAAAGTAKAKSDAANPETTAKPDIANNDAAGAKPETASAKPDTAKPEAAPAKPDTAERGAAGAKPEAATAKPDAAEAKPEATAQTDAETTS